MTKIDLKKRILAGISGPSGSALIPRSDVEKVEMNISLRADLLSDMAFECGCSVTRYDESYLFTPDHGKGSFARLQEAVQETAKLQSQRWNMTSAFFTPDEIQSSMYRNLAAGLRQLADAIEGGTIDGKFLDCKGHGFGPKNDDRAHLLLRVDLAAPIRQIRLEGENNVSGRDQGK